MSFSRSRLQRCEVFGFDTYGRWSNVRTMCYLEWQNLPHHTCRPCSLTVLRSRCEEMQVLTRRDETIGSQGKYPTICIAWVASQVVRGSPRRFKPMNVLIVG